MKNQNPAPFSVRGSFGHRAGVPGNTTENLTHTHNTRNTHRQKGLYVNLYETLFMNTVFSWRAGRGYDPFAPVVLIV
jgi:hypothetical protein